MYLDADEAKTDVVLAAAAAIFGGAVRGMVSQIPGYPRQGVAALVVDLAWIFALTGLVPLLLARYRRDGAAAFGLAGPRRGISFGLLLATPVVAAEVARAWLAGAGVGRTLFGRLAIIVAGAPVSVTVVLVGQLALMTLGSFMLVTFLSHRAAAGFPRSPGVLVARLLRTLGLWALAVAAATGLLRAIAGYPVGPVLLNVAALAVILLLVDQRIPAGVTLPRAAVLAPVVAVGLLHVFATGGLLRGDLATALYAGSLGAGVAIAVAGMTHVRETSWAVVPLLLAVHWWPTCLSPLALEIALAC